MSNAEDAKLGESPLTRDLSPEQRDELETRQILRVGKELVWFEPDGRLRRERVSNLTYVQTPHGVFRVSRITGQVVEV